LVARAAESLDLDHLDLLIIENVGNLVCPADYDLGEDLRVVLLSVTEGEDKPLKYPVMFKTADVVIVNKTDIAEAVGFERDAALNNIHRIVPKAVIFEVSARTGQGWKRGIPTSGSACTPRRLPNDRCVAQSHNRCVAGVASSPTRYHPGRSPRRTTGKPDDGGVYRPKSDT
jgi:hypothetical protein